MTEIRIIDGDRPQDKPRAGKRRALGEDEQATCWRCLTETGIETSAVTPVTLAPRRGPDGRKCGGTRVWACAHCLGRGHITEMFR